MENTLIFFDTLTLKQLTEYTGLLQMKFRDYDGKEYIWTPKWDDLRILVDWAIRVELHNNGYSTQASIFKEFFQGQVLFLDLAEVIDKCENQPPAADYSPRACQLTPGWGG